MTDQTAEPEDHLGSLYRRAFKDYGNRALWNLRPIENQTLPTRWRSQKPCERTAAWTGGAWRNRLKACAVPLTKLQSHLLRVLAAGRSPDSYVAGGVAINREGPRFSGDIDIFQDSENRLVAAAEADAKALIEAGLALSWLKIQSGKRQAEVEGLGETMHLEWVADSAFFISLPNGTSFSVMCSTPWTSPRTRHPPPPTGANPATSLTL